MSEAKRVEKIVKELELYIFGGNQEIVKMTCKILGITNYIKIENLEKIFKRTDKIVIKDLNFYSQDNVEAIIKHIASCEFHHLKETEKYFKSHSLPFGDEKNQSHWDSDFNLLAKKMIEYSLFEDDEKEILYKILNTYKYESTFSSEIFKFFCDDLDVKLKLSAFVDEIKNQDLDYEFRLKLLADILKKINLSLIKNNEVISTRAYKYKKEIAKKINQSISYIKQQIEIELAYYIKTINSNDFLGFIDNTEPREFLIGKLIENNKNLEKFFKLEKKLISNKLLTNEKNKWLGTAKGFVEFYQFCENNKIFNSNYKNNSKGIKILRKMYRFEDGQSIDKLSKRIKYNETSKFTYYSFLSLI